MPRESVIAKAARLLTSGRIFVVEVDREHFLARVRGDSGRVYTTGYNGRWVCTCDHRATTTPCSHLVAVKLIYVEPEPGGTP